MDDYDTQIVDELRKAHSTEQLMRYEDVARQVVEHLTAARTLVLELPGDGDISDLDDMIDESRGAVELLREARHG